MLSHAGDVPQVREARDIVTAEVAAYLTERSAEAVAPTVAALRSRAQELVDREMSRLERRTPELTESDRAEVRRAVHRVVEKLLHAPTVRVKEMARDGPGRQLCPGPVRAVRPRPARRLARLRPADPDRARRRGGDR